MAEAKLPKIFQETEQDGQEDHCYLCDDGGRVVQCVKCCLFCCFNYETGDGGLPSGGGEQAEDDTTLPCITLPMTYKYRPRTAFICPTCLANSPDRAIDYTVNRGARTTFRRISASQVHIILTYLPSLETNCKHMFDPVIALLGAFHVLGFIHRLALPHVLHEHDRKAIENCGYAYHLVHILFTESNPGGGWWFGDEQSSELDMIKLLIGPYDKMARKASSARIFVFACGLNLRGLGVIDEIAQGLHSQPWDSILIPTATAFSPQEVAGILPPLFIHLCYMGTSLSSSLVKTWASSKRASHHTNWIVCEQAIDRSRQAYDGSGAILADDRQVLVQRYTYGSEWSRPWGYVLPLASSFCPCARGTQQIRWTRQGSLTKAGHGEHLARFCTSCKHTLIRIAVWLQGVNVLYAAGGQILSESFDWETGKFPLDSPDAWHAEYIKVRPPATGKDVKTREHKEPWTRRGQLHFQRTAEGPVIGTKATRP